MKKVLLVMTLLVIVVGLAGCAQKPATTSPGLDTTGDTNRTIVEVDASKHYVVYSHDKVTSKEAASMMLKSSFSVINCLVGGYDAWVASGGYTEK